MSTSTIKRNTAHKDKSAGRGPRVRLKTLKEVRNYFDTHLKPIRLNAKGEPVYSNADIKKLNVILPDEH